MGIIMRYNRKIVMAGQRAEDGKEQAPDHVRDAQRHLVCVSNVATKKMTPRGQTCWQRDVGKHES